jgi:tRNA threonylcarbamoyladenosine biosynthesis protein TsaB
MNLLAIETSTEACSVALSCDGAVVERFALAPRRHTELLLPMIEAVLAEAGVGPTELDGLTFGAGPGAFTGLRIACAFTQGIALARDVPVVAVSSLAALAQGVARTTGTTHLLPALDARMGEIYCGAYAAGTDGLVMPLAQDCVCPPAGARWPSGADWVGCGPGWAAYGDALRHALAERLHSVIEDAYPHAQDVARLGEIAFKAGLGEPAEQALPVYLRDQVVTR